MNMPRILTYDYRSSLQKVLKSHIFSGLIVIGLIALLPARDLHASTTSSSAERKMTLETIPPYADSGYGYKLQYYIFAPIDISWSFKTDFDSNLLLTSDELIGHRIVKTIGNSVITENRYATAPGLRFLWKTVVLEEQYRMEFELLNAAECRHDFHFGSIQLSPDGEFTKVTQIVYFDFTGASLWVKYPWYGGMEDTLTQMVEWEQETILKYREGLKLANDRRRNELDIKSPEHSGPAP
jgi:hypothetical protein